MQLTFSGQLKQFLRVMQGSLFSALEEELGLLTGKLRQLIAVLELVQIEAIIDVHPRSDQALKAELQAEQKRCQLLGYRSAEEVRYNERTTVERVNARLKDEFGGRMIRVRGHAKVMCHLMFGIVALAVDQILRLVT
jgi:hypothetical protein